MKNFDVTAAEQFLGLVYLRRTAHTCTPLYPAGGQLGVCAECGALTGALAPVPVVLLRVPEPRP